MVAEDTEYAPAEAAYEPVKKDRDDKGAIKAGPALDESIRKADRLFTEQNWSAAAEAYRDLLRRYPTHKDAPKWRARMNQSLVAEQELRQAKTKKAAKAKSSNYDTLEGAKQ